MSSLPKIPPGPAGIRTTEPAEARRPNSLWIAWNEHRRTIGLCEAWGLPLEVVRTRRTGFARWIERVARTLALLHRHRPEILFIQNPSLALTVLAFLARRAYGYYLVMDAHNEGVRPFDRPGALIGWITRYALRSADTTIVTNVALANDVRVAGGRPLVLPDSLPVPPALPGIARETDRIPQVVVVATFRPDEPIEALFAAAVRLPQVQFAFSGDPARLRGKALDVPRNVRLTGFLPDREYWTLLAGADVVCDLTLKPDCLVCGAYEALALGKPMVLSDNPATRELFGPAAILTGSAPDEIVDALTAALASRDMLAENALKLRETFRERWRNEAAAVWDALLAAASPNRRGTA